MNQHLQRAELLLAQDRHAQAEGELRLHLADQPNDGHAHALLARSLLGQEKLDDAEREARAAIALAPTNFVGHAMLSAVLGSRRRFDEAQQAIDEALRLAPDVAQLYAAQGEIALLRYRWQDALVAAETGLMLDPDNLDCRNVQAQALTKLGRKADAARVLGDALAQDPDNADTHANQGWNLLHQSRPREALEHFREALRLEPGNEFARAGMVEALKAKNIVYRLLLSFFLWMSRLPPSTQFGVVIGGYFAMRVVRGIARTFPALAPFLMPVLILYFAFCVMTWVASPLSDLMLRMSRFGKHALSRDQRLGSNWFGLCLGVAILGLVLWGVGLATGMLLMAAIGLGTAAVFGLCLIPVSAIFRCDAGWPRTVMAVCALGLIALGMFAFLLLPILAEVQGTDVDLAKDSVGNWVVVFILGVFLSQFLANGLALVRPTK